MIRRFLGYVLFRLDGSIDFTREVMQGEREGGSANALAMAVAESASALHLHCNESNRTELGQITASMPRPIELACSLDSRRHPTAGPSSPPLIPSSRLTRTHTRTHTQGDMNSQTVR
jgi:hypothetical protein